VPQPGKAEAIAEGAIAGTSSSLVQAGVQGAVSLEQDPPSARPAHKSVQELLARYGKKSERYIVDAEIGRGGMGVVLRAVDCDIRREVAIKYLLDPNDGRKRMRFTDEAQITGQLEHPNIVPIHELSIDANKRLFFSMKIVHGRSLAQVIEALRKEPKTTEKEYSLARLLGVFVGVCNAVAYAHSRGVVHRDLKPSNIMLGNFGEVYVMDWGLAKVRGSTADAAEAEAAPQPNLSGSSRSSKVDTSREPEADFTRDGAVLGTPVYMSPEQAAGNVAAIDQRSDVYALGAILYETLTLLPPVETQGGHIDVIMRVMAGEIVPPAQRSSQRAKAGNVPKELAAIAMKALARQPQDRYPSVEALRSDIERFQEGRSVSAKPDTVRELVWKLCKRNRAVSLVTAVATVLVAVLWVRGAWGDYQQRKLRRERFVPAFLEAAHFAVEQKKFDNALVQVSTAVEYDPERAEAILLKGQLLMVNGNYAAAQGELEHYLKLRPSDADAAQLVDLCRKGRPQDATTAAAIAEVFRRQNRVTLAASMVQSRENLLEIYGKQIDRAWPGLGKNLQMDKDGMCTFAVPFPDRGKVADLMPLKGIPLSSLSLRSCGKVNDLGPLQGMPLTALNLDGCSQIKDLTPLQGMKLRSLSLGGCQVRDLAPLHGMPLISLNLTDCSLIKDLTPLEGLKLTSLSLANCSQVTDLTLLKRMPLTSLNLSNCRQFGDLTVLQTLPLTALDLSGTNRQDLAFLRGMKLTNLGLSYNPIRDLAPLRGMKLSVLSLSACQIEDLTPLQGMPLTQLDLYGCGQVRDLAPLRGAKLVSLNVANCGQLHDLTPLQGMPLAEIYLVPKNITKGLAVLRDMRTLKFICIGNGPNDRFTAEQFWKKYDAGDFK
jgi:serine/threonine protein kinase/Leucine-rich repeat (LRR) protein